MDTRLMNSAWKRTNKNIFRLETLQKYNVQEDLILFQKWKKNKLDVNSVFSAWFKNLKKTKQKGVKIQRVRVASLPISEYLKYEIDIWKYSQRYGEQIYFLDVKNFNRIKKQVDFKIEDFWMFDDEKIVLFHYRKGNLIKEELVSKDKIKNYKDLKNMLLKHVVPMSYFIKV